jgi:hypothetical protein
MGWGETVHLVRRPLTGLLYQPRMIDDECGAVDGMRIGRGNWSTRRKLAPVPLCPPQISHDSLWTRTRASTVGSRRLNAWAMARPCRTITKRRIILFRETAWDHVRNKIWFPTSPSYDWNNLINELLGELHVKSISTIWGYYLNQHL